MSAVDIAAQCRPRIAQRVAYQLDIGGVRTRDEREIVGRVLAGWKRSKKPRLKLVAA